MKLATVIAARGVLQGLSDSLPFSVALKIARFLKQSEEPNRLFEERRDAIINDYAQRDAETGEYRVPDNKIPEASQKILALGDEEIPDITIRFSADDLEGVNLTASEAYALLDLIDN